MKKLDGRRKKEEKAKPQTDSARLRQRKERGASTTQHVHEPAPHTQLHNCTEK